MFGHTQIVLISLVVETLLFVGVLFKIFIVIQMLFNVMLFNAMFNAMLMLFKKEKYKLGQQSVLFYTQSKLSTGREQQFTFAFIHKADIRYRWSTSRESADTTQKGIGALAKNW